MAGLKVVDYNEVKMGLHNFIRMVQMPVTAVIMALLLQLHWNDYPVYTMLMPEAGFCVFGITMVIITEFGFIFNAAYSYFSVLLFTINNTAMTFYLLLYSYFFTTASNKIVFCYAGSLLFCLVWNIVVYLFYRRRKYLFVESKEDKIMKKSALKKQDIDFNPKFERERMSHSQLKEHMNKRFDEIDDSVKPKQDTAVFADPYEK